MKTKSVLSESVAQDLWVRAGNKLPMFESELHFARLVAAHVLRRAAKEASALYEKRKDRTISAQETFNMGADIYSRLCDLAAIERRAAGK